MKPVTDQGKGYNTVRVSMRSYFSTHHLWASRHFAERSRIFEASHAGRPKFEVIGAVIEASTFLESAINELCDVAHRGTSSGRR